jgi:phenylalanyl-tRNA synthetase beta chain
LLGSLVQVLKYNLARKAPRVQVFELGRVFRRDASVPSNDRTVAGVSQPRRVAGLAYGPLVPLQWSQADRVVDFFDIKADVQALLAPLEARFTAGEHPAMHPGRCAEVWLGEQSIGHVGELHPRWRQSYELPQSPVMFELDLDAVLTREVPQAVAVPRQQSVWRDLALVVSDKVCHDALMATLKADPQALIRTATLFDIYRPAQATADLAAGERSWAVRLELLDDPATLTDERVDATMAAAIARATEAHGARLRA